MNWYHYTCDHGHHGITVDGTLLPTRELIDPSVYQQTPAWRRALLDLIWLTDLDAPDRAALGPTSHSLTCDRTRHRWRAIDYTPMRYTAIRRDLPQQTRRELESATGVLPMHWWVAYTPVPAVYDPIVAVTS